MSLEGMSEKSSIIICEFYTDRKLIPYVWFLQ